MAPENITPKQSGIFYGWFTLAGVALVIFIVGGSFVHAFGVLLPVITVEFGWDRAQVALALTLGILAFGLPSPLYGLTVHRFGPRMTIIIGNALAGVGLAGVYFVQEVWHLYFLYILIGLGGGFGGYIASTTVVNNWFIRRRSLALGIFQASAGLGGLVFPLLVTALISAVDWRTTWLILAGIVIIIPVTIGGFFIIRNKPEDMGLVPDGMTLEPPIDIAEIRVTSSKVGDEGSGWSILNIMKKPTAWFIAGFTAANAFTVGTLLTHQIAYFQDIGNNPMTAATSLSVLSAFALVGSLGFGFLALKFKVRNLALGAFICQILGLVILLSTKNLGLLYIFIILVGISYGSLTAAMPTFVGAYYPRDRYAQVLGVVFPFQVVTNAFAATLAGVIFDATSSYTPAFIAAVCVSMVGLFFAFMARRPESA